MSGEVEGEATRREDVRRDLRKVFMRGYKLIVSWMKVLLLRTVRDIFHCRSRTCD